MTGILRGAAAGLCVGLGLAGAAWFGVGGLEPERVVTVKGLAEREVMADVATWRLSFRGEGEERADAIADAMAARQAAETLGRKVGLSPGEMTAEPFALSIDRSYFRTANGGQEERLRYTAKGAVRFRSSDIDKISALVAQSGTLLDQGVLLGQSDYGEAPQALYSFTGINEIKPGMIADATQNARLAARRFAEDSGSRVGRIMSANQGVVQFLSADGDYEERYEPRKLIRVVSTVRYELVD